MTEKRSDGFYLILNDETEEKLDFYNLRMNDKNVPYITVKKGEFEARFSRPAYYEFTKYLNQEGDRFYIEERGTRYELKAQK
jgi:hypothetical protein